MYSRDRRRLIYGAIIALVVIAAVAVYFTVFRTTTHTERGIATDAKKTITVDGVDLAAEVITPRGIAHPPLIVLPGSFGGAPSTLHQVSLLFARRGYLVVTYAQRGFGGSTGEADFGGPDTQRDARGVITWALDHTAADPKRVGMLGLSYGAGISLLTAAHDPRVRVVGALSTWTNVAETYTDIGTPHTNALRWVIGNEDNTSKYDATTRHLQTTLLDHPADLGPELHRISAVRSPATYVKQLNKNKPAIMIANGFQDSIFGPSQLLPFFDELKVPKRLELNPGDHGGPEHSALSGAQNEVMDDVRAWFDHYLRGVSNGINHESPIVVKDLRTGELVPYKSWPVATKKDKLALPEPGLTSAAVPSSTWQATMTSGTDSGADSAPLQLVSSASYRPPTVKLSSIDSKAAFIWSGNTLANGFRLSGTPVVTLNVAASTPTATLFLYLYDVDGAGVGTLVDMQPYTATGLKAGDAVPQSIPMQPITWSVPSGDRLVLVIDTVDPHFLSLTRPGTTITVTSNKKDTSSFSAPTSSS